MTALVECVPNFSEARRPEIMAQIIEKIQSVPGVALLDHSSDQDHNRSVVTMVGAPDAVAEAAFRAIAHAAQTIDLNQHTGEHPRIGATDVVPFIPIQDVSMEECVILAKKLGQRVAQELNVPVYLYEEAASLPERQNLENIRKGQFEGLKEEIKANPARKPDFGPCELGPAGATVIGARQPLIAFNVYLTTENVAIASKIAKVVRQSSGGFRFVKAMGVLVEGRAQVSMNLTNFHKTAIHTVVETIRREAARHGVGIHHTELIGMIPQEALIDSARWYLQLDAFNNNQVLEQKLAAAHVGGAAAVQEDFIDRVAAGTPTPGGGSAAAHTGALGAALAAMVARLTVGRKKYAEVEPQMLAVLDEAEVLRHSLSDAVEQDSAAFEAFMQANKLPKDTDEEKTARLAAIEKATFQAAEVPLSVARQAVRVFELANQAASLGNLNAVSDAGSSAAHARAALTAAGMNVRINLLSYANNPHAVEMLDELGKLEARAADLQTELLKVLAERGGLTA